MNNMLEAYANNSVPLHCDDKTPVSNFIRITLKTGIAVLAISGFAVLLNLPAVEKLFNIDALYELINGAGALAPLIFFVLTTGAVSIGVPRLIFYALGGAVFGFVEGLVLAQGAALLGSLGPYYFAKWGARKWVLKKLKPVLSETLLRKSSILDVFLIRHLPLWGVFINMFLGVKGVRLRAFLIGSFFGLLPHGVVVSLVGSGIGESSMLMLISKFWAAIFILVIILVIAVRFAKKSALLGIAPK